MKRFRILCLTDHATHSKENSLYALVSAMTKHDACEKIVVASRSAKVNNDFFYKLDYRSIHGKLVDTDFNFENAKTGLIDGLRVYDPQHFDIIFLRLPRPTSDLFLKTLDDEFSSACIVNSPSGIINCSNKLVLLNLQEVCPPMRFCKTIVEILDFAQQHDLVLKPLKEYGGKGLVKIQGNVLNDGKKDYNTLSYLQANKSFINNEGYLAMKYLKNVDQGDKRLIVVDGEILAASLRLPAKNSWLCNVSMGGQSIKAEPTKEEIEIIDHINPYLRKKGILIYGADTLVDDDGKRILSEINALSIGGFPQAEKQTGKPIIRTTIDKIINYATIRLNR